MKCFASIPEHHEAARGSGGAGGTAERHTRRNALRQTSRLRPIHATLALVEKGDGGNCVIAELGFEFLELALPSSLAVQRVIERASHTLDLRIHEYPHSS